MKIKLLASSLMLLALAFVSCDDNTDSIGSSLIDEVDKINIKADTFEISSRTIIADSVLARNITGYLGRVKDPETGAIINGDYMAQFNTLESFEMPKKDSLVTWQKNREIIADSCEIRLFFNKYYGDSLSQMKLTVYEMDKPMREDTTYYSNYTPFPKLIREGGIKQNRTYTLADFTEADSVKSNSNYVPNIRIRLNDSYTDKDGVTYNNYGTYLMRKYYEDPENFRNSYKFLHNIMPGFFFKMTSGLGSMAYINSAQIYIHFKYNQYVETKPDTVINTSTSFTGTEEVLQTTTFSNDKDRIKELAAVDDCTYLKTPAGLFTELTLPVEEIMNGHDGETLNTARVELKRLNNGSSDLYALDIPQTVLMVHKDSLENFFKDNKVADYKTSFIATYSSTSNSYTFNNISGMVNMMHNEKMAGRASEDWNKVVLVPVTPGYSSTSSGGTASIIKLTHDMSLTSTRLVGGRNNPHEPIKISVIYSKFNGR